MRSFFAGLALFLSFLTGTVALEAFVAHHVVLDPDRAGQALSAALDEPELRERLLHRAVPGYRKLPQPVQTVADQLAGTSSAHRAVEKVSLSDDGTIALAPLQLELAQSLRTLGQPQLAAQLTAVSGTTITVPEKYLSRYRDARETSWRVAVLGAAATLVLFLLALLLSPKRRRTVRSIGVSALLACGAAALLYWALPGVAGLVSSGSTGDVAAVVLRAERPAVLLMLLPVAVVAVVLVVGSLLARPRRTSSTA